jgi:3-methylcrotonyl-CoA carboxylase alpha subunit
MIFKSLLIANRGEIACRIMRTARRLGIRTVAVFSEADAGARHVREADSARCIGPAPPQRSYLNIDAILKAASDSGAQAVHPGYGFLSENAEFADRAVRAGLIFVGPPAAAILAMGSKSAARERMRLAGVPIVPGYHGGEQDLPAFTAAALSVGYPVLLKASAGGGGRGMRVVRQEAELAAALESARREARGAFGDDRMLLEKYIERPRHIEIQVFADTHGNTIHLFERDCSVQRRHQKVLEESPAPNMSEKRREEMGKAAVTVARAVGYVGAGTVEFIADADKWADDAFYFMEMNTRLQVEHPVTEMVTGFDLVEWQLRVAAGEALPREQGTFGLTGHAIEARIYAEDPARNFLPAGGTLRHLRFPTEGPHVRVDSGVQEGDQIGIHYDPLIAKLIVWDRDRPAALARLETALADTEISGPAHNLLFLAAVAKHREFSGGGVATDFIARNQAELVPPPGPASDMTLALASLEHLVQRADRAKQGAPNSPWSRTDYWRPSRGEVEELLWRDGAAVERVQARATSGGWELEIRGRKLVACGSCEADRTLFAEIDGARVAASVVRHGEEVDIIAPGLSHRLHRVDPLAAAEQAELPAGRLIAPMPGRVVAVHVKAGASVEKGAALMVIEAMKMEHTIAAPLAGRIERVCYAVGDIVPEGAELVALESDGSFGTR